MSCISLDRRVSVREGRKAIEAERVGGAVYGAKGEKDS